MAAAWVNVFDIPGVTLSLVARDNVDQSSIAVPASFTIDGPGKSLVVDPAYDMTSTQIRVGIRTTGLLASGFVPDLISTFGFWIRITTVDVDNTSSTNIRAFVGHLSYFETTQVNLSNNPFNYHSDIPPNDALSPPNSHSEDTQGVDDSEELVFGFTLANDPIGGLFSGELQMELFGELDGPPPEEEFDIEIDAEIGSKISAEFRFSTPGPPREIAFDAEIVEKFSLDVDISAKVREELILKTVVPQMIPRFVFEEHPRFVHFLEAFCDYVELRYGGPQEDTPGPYHLLKTLRDIPDIDRTSAGFLTHFKAVYGVDLPDVIAQDIRSLIKSASEFYRSKGTTDSYRFFFRSVFNTFSSIYLPKVDLLRVSDGRWYVPYQVRLRNIGDSSLVTEPDLLLLVDSQVRAVTTGAFGFVGAIVEQEIVGSGDPTTFFWVEFVSRRGTFLEGETLEFTLPDGRVRSYFISVADGIQEAPGYWLTDDGHLSSRKKIQDSDFWQDFSYQISSNIGLSNIVNPLFRALHPAGLKLFARVREDVPTVIEGYPDDYNFLLYRFLIIHVWNWSEVGVPFITFPDDQDGDPLRSVLRKTSFAQMHFDWGIWAAQVDDGSEFSAAESALYDIGTLNFNLEARSNPGAFLYAVAAERKILGTSQTSFDEGPFSSLRLQNVGENRADFTLSASIAPDILTPAISAATNKVSITSLPYMSNPPEVNFVEWSNLTYTTEASFVENGQNAVLLFVNGRKVPRSNTPISGKVRVAYDPAVGALALEEDQRVMLECLLLDSSSLVAWQQLTLPFNSTSATLSFSALTHDCIAFNGHRCLIPGVDFFVEGNSLTLSDLTEGNLEVYAFSSGLCRQTDSFAFPVDGNSVRVVLPSADQPFNFYGGRMSLLKDPTNLWAVNSSVITHGMQYWFRPSVGETGSDQAMAVSRPIRTVAESTVEFPDGFTVAAPTYSVVEGVPCITPDLWTVGVGGATIGNATVRGRVVDSNKTFWTWCFSFRLGDWGLTVKSGTVIAAFGNPDTGGSDKSIIAIADYPGYGPYDVRFQFYDAVGALITTLADPDANSIEPNTWYVMTVRVHTGLGANSFIDFRRNGVLRASNVSAANANINNLAASGQNVYLGGDDFGGDILPVSIGPGYFHHSNVQEILSPEIVDELGRQILSGDDRVPYYL